MSLCCGCGRPLDFVQMASGGGYCQSCLAAMRCYRCGGAKERVDVPVCWACRSHLERALPPYEQSLRSAIACGLTVEVEGQLAALRERLGLIDGDVAHLQSVLLQARQSPTYVMSWNAAAQQKARAEAEAAQQRLAAAHAAAEAEREAERRRVEVAQQEAIRQQRVEAGLQEFARYFAHAVDDGVITGEEWVKLQQIATGHGLNWAQALQLVRPKALELLERTIVFASEDGVLTEEEESFILRLCEALCLPPDDAAKVRTRLFRLKNLLHIRSGGLPRIEDASLYLESDEACHLKVDATYEKAGSKRAVGGKLIATTRKLLFSSSAGGGSQIAWKSVTSIERHRGKILLELSQKAGAGSYRVDDPEMTEAILDTIVRMQKRRLLATNPEGPSRRIPHQVRLAVWHRDGGCCAQCGANTYLEYDHIIPFSKGGASTLDNVQLLCRKCNLEKSDRI